MAEEAVKIFYSYSRRDLEMRNTLEDHLAGLRRARKISTWHDLELEAGSEREPNILNKLNTADIILLLVSRNFIASDYCFGTEMKRAIERHNSGEARVIPIILRPCDWNHPDVPFSKLNVLPTYAKPITSWADQDEAFTIVAQRIRETADQLRAKKIVDPPPTLVQPITRKELQKCDPAKILFIKNVKNPEGWAYLLDQRQQPESRTFELMWRLGSHGFQTPVTGDLMILHQRAKVTHVVEFLSNEVRKTDTGFFRQVKAVWIPEQDWSQLPHQKEFLGFSPRYADGNTHSLKSPGFTTFHEAWSNLEEFQNHIANEIQQS
ncbi:MAG: toll/interleukin-1 receptor domain-containing protein [Tildeniella nuda ZEHNDER 1965/U140]|jgi:hypothetical protein|nr:toll/interleukin-1 receptor domain-containing protein [Tildeniella nuda ZEHNDER 1965/U140]